MKSSLILLALVSSCYGTIFQCTYSVISWPGYGSRYTCEAKIASSSNATALMGISGTHLSGNGLANVEVLDVASEKTLSKLPDLIEVYFPNLIGLRWNNGSLITISASVLKYPNLTFVAFNSNNLTLLDGGLFQYAQTIREIHFPFNKIEQVGANIFSNLNNLTIANFEGNVCVNFTAGTTQTVQDLKILLANQCPQKGITTVTSSSSSSTTPSTTSGQSTTSRLSTTIATPTTSTASNPASMMSIIMLFTMMIIVQQISQVRLINQ